jgi:MFS family permease
MSKNKSLFAINISVFLIMLGVGMIVAILPQRMIDLSGSPLLVGWLASAFAITFVLAQVPIGHLADKISFKKFLLFGYLLCSLTGLLYLKADSPLLILLGRMLQGIGEVPLWALAPALLSLQYADNKGKAIGQYNASLHFGLFIGPLLGMLFLQTTNQDNYAFLFFALISFVCALIVFLFVKDPDQDELIKIETFKLKDILNLVGNRPTLIVLIGITLYGACYGLTVSLIPAFLITAKGFSQISINIVFSLFYIAISLSQLTTGPLSDRKGRRMLMVWGLLIVAIGLSIFSLFDSLLIYAFIILASFGLGMFAISSITYLNETVPAALKGTISGAYYLFWGIGYFGGPLVIGKLSSILEMSVCFAIVAGLIVIEAFLLLRSGDKKRLISL